MLPTMLPETPIPLLTDSMGYLKEPHIQTKVLGLLRSLNDTLLVFHRTTRTEKSFELLVERILKESVEHNAKFFIQKRMWGVGGLCAAPGGHRTEVKRA